MSSADRVGSAPCPCRRGFLGAALAAAAAVTSGGLLTACSSGTGRSSAKGGVAAGSALQNALPAFVASTLVTPDIPGSNGSTLRPRLEHHRPDPQRHRRQGRRPHFQKGMLIGAVKG
ncbi:hypothetical protein BX265_6340 [Streptomyces sp. TLI_235]|nr:hypothetical protein [Streptomyces sp. TLI_235]PBC71727.1 hypothetical protein BX265_6340 [Streptomyces sp. TLI_235]